MLEAVDAGPPRGRDPLEERAKASLGVPDLWGPLDDVAAVETLAADPVAGRPKLRIFRPREPVGTILYMHGGGWMTGDLDTHEGPCRMLTNSSSATVVAIDYRRAPEDPFPAAVRDCDAALDWLIRARGDYGLDPARIVLCGDSAGGNLAATLARHAREREIALCGQVLIYPLTDSGSTLASRRRFADGFFLTAEDIGWILDHYASASDRGDPDLAPLLAEDLSRLAPCYLATADHDPLRDEGRAYAMRLIEAGNDVTYEEWPGVVHGFWVMRSRTTATAALVERVAEWTRSRLQHRTV
jgi:acetyl esterase